MSKRTGIMLPKMFTEKAFDKLPKPVLVQAKIEGDRMRTKMGSSVVGCVKMLSSGGKERISVPHIYDELRELISGTRIKYIEPDGELYCHGMRHSEIRSIVSRTKNIHPNHKKIKYYIYDLVATDPQIKRLELLRGMFSKLRSFDGTKYVSRFKYIRYVPYTIVHTLEEMQLMYDSYLKAGYEGIIIRHATAGYKRSKVSTMLKLKPRVSRHFKIVGFVEEVSKEGDTKDTLGAFVCLTDEGQKFSVGTGITDLQRKYVWENRDLFIGKCIKIRFQDYTKARNVPKMQSVDKQWADEYTTPLT